jgi:RNA polymerase sigma-70 factor (ECF subfamily)
MMSNGNREFPSTSWTLIVAAAGPRRDGPAQRALETLCQAYWYQLYVYARRQPYPAEDAADLVQGYFAKLLEKDYLQDARSERGRFRSFLIASFRHYLSNERDRKRSQMSQMGFCGRHSSGLFQRLVNLDVASQNLG